MFGFSVCQSTGFTSACGKCVGWPQRNDLLPRVTITTACGVTSTCTHCGIFNALCAHRCSECCVAVKHSGPVRDCKHEYSVRIFTKLQMHPVQTVVYRQTHCEAKIVLNPPEHLFQQYFTETSCLESEPVHIVFLTVDKL